MRCICAVFKRGLLRGLLGVAVSVTGNFLVGARVLARFRPKSNSPSLIFATTILGNPTKITNITPKLAREHSPNTAARLRLVLLAAAKAIPNASNA